MIWVLVGCQLFTPDPDSQDGAILIGTLLYGVGSRYLPEENPNAQLEWFEWLVENGADILVGPLWRHDPWRRWNLDTEPLLDQTIRPELWNLSHRIIQLGCNVNTLNRYGESPLDLLIHGYCEWSAGFRGVLTDLLRRGARAFAYHPGDDGSVHLFGQWETMKLRPRFVEALLSLDIEFLIEEWPNRWQEPRSIPEPVKNVCTDPLCLDLVRLIDSGPDEPNRASRVAAIRTRLESQELQLHTFSVDQESPSKLCNHGLIRDELRRSGNAVHLNVLQLLAILAEPSLLRTALSARHLQTQFQLQLQEEYPGQLSPVNLAIHSGSVECLSVLFDNGANPQEEWRLPNEYLERSNGRLLHRAIEIGDMAVFKCLIEYGAFPVSKNKQKPLGITEVQLAVEMGRIDFLGLLLQVDIDSRFEARAAAESFNKKTILDWIDQHWMGKSQPDPPQMTGYIELDQQFGHSSGIISLDQEDYDMSGMN
ncbi:hypothetical protein TWF718_005986 [Orbilia javanica]|uniref:Uncharacterized protein n=1 Tax=Orbilia javanica TaxID=47235 RepID=A0AAN8RJV0_9PEZI